jgi:molecular chaperone DnaK (HSP70)
MGKVIAIDLGTTNSVVAVYGKYPEAGRVVNEEVTVLMNADGSLTTPSVVVSDGGSGEIIVGHVAKQRILRRRSEGDPVPVSFVKRHMGRDTRFRLGKNECGPAEISGHILHALIKQAEDKLGDTVEAVMITVPAYFDLRQRELTEQAADVHANQLRASEGLPRVKVLGTLLEPIAAAHAYCVQDERDDLCIFVYDLGGGTFDATILEKRDGVFQVMTRHGAAAFDGDPLLGGYNFDKAIADKLLAELKQYFALDLDLDGNIEDQARYAKLISLAEQAKIKVSDESNPPWEIFESDIFSDKSTEAKPVNISSRVFSHDELTSLISGEIDRTVGICERALAKVGLSAEKVDEVVLVGGSSKLSLVAKRLEAALGKRTSLFSPDLAVAVGAAYYAYHSAGSTEGPEELGLHPIPSETDIERLMVTGCAPAPGAGRVVVRRDDGEEFCGDVDSSGAYSIDVELREGAENSLTIELHSPDGPTVTYLKRVRHNEDSESEDEGISAPTFLTKTLYLELETGPDAIAVEGVELPFNVERTFFAAGEGHELIIPLLEERRRIANLGIPLGEAIPHGHPVKIVIEVAKSGQITGSTHVGLAGQVYSRDFEVRFEPRPMQTRNELRKALRELKKECSEEMEGLDANMRMKYASDVDELFERCEAELASDTADALPVERDMLEIRQVLRNLSSNRVWIPTLTEFKEKAQFTRGFAHEQSDQSASQQIEAIVTEGERAFGKDKVVWARANTQLKDVARRLAEKREGGADVDPAMFHAFMLQDLTRLAGAAKEKGYNNDHPIFEDIVNARHKLTAVNTKSDGALNELVKIRDRHLQPLWQHLDHGRLYRGGDQVRIVGN